MFRLMPYSLKTLWRHRSRTFLTVSGSGIAFFVFCFVGAVQQGMDQLLERRESDRSLIVFQANKFCPATSHLPQDYDREISRVDGVREVVPIQVFTNNCRASLDVVVFYGVPPKKIRKVRDFQLIAGSWSDFESHQDAAIVGRAVAQRRGISWGDKFSIGEVTVNVAGLFTSRDPGEENTIYTHLEFLQRRRGFNLVGTVTQFEVLLHESADTETVSAGIDQAYQAGPVQTDTRPKSVFQAKSLGDLTHLIELTHVLGYACVGLVLALVATSTIMSVQDRAQEYAVLHTIGFTSFRVFRLVLVESTLLGFLGGAIGIVAAMLVLRYSGLAVGAEAVTISFVPSMRLAMTGLAVSWVTGTVAGLAPAIYAARIEIVPAMRQA